MADFLLTPSIALYFVIFFGKILEVTVSTVRSVLINRGERLRGTILALFEITMWLTITGTVLAGIREDFFRCVVFVIAFALGNYLGSLLEEKLAFGLAALQVIVPEVEALGSMDSDGTYCASLVDVLREHKFAVTVFHNGEGKDGAREMLMLYLKRNRIREAENLIRAHSSKALIAVLDSKKVLGGFLKK